jgi:lysozyme family protein
MAASSYDEALARLLVHEGGYSNHPSDPGGPTNWGITIFDYRKYVNPAATAADVRSMPVEVAKKIYRDKYWNAMRCDELAPGVDYCIFDYGVNSGTGRAPKILRRLVGLPQTPAAVTDAVIAAAGARDPKILIDAICDERLAFLRGLRTWDVFGNGWGRRVREVRAAALAMAQRATAQQADKPPAKPVAPEPAANKPDASAKGRPQPLPARRTFAWAAAAVAVVAAAAHWLDAHPVMTIAGVVLAALVALIVISNPTTTTAKGRSRPS